MAGLLVYKDLEINSHRGKYKLSFVEKDKLFRNKDFIDNSHVVIDQKIVDLYSKELSNFLSNKSVLVVEAKEENKSLEKIPFYVEHLIKNKFRRNQCLIAIGGGIIQDITCFLASNMFRGVSWRFIPTTLLSQADSCIGSKSSINCGKSKNILGSFNPPDNILICLEFLKTLMINDIRSGVGEMLKVHAIEGASAFNDISENYSSIFEDPKLMHKYMYRSLDIKKKIIEEDEFDRGIRHIMNYGHTFGHAIESATNFKIPHGIAVTIGMDMANYIAMKSSLTSEHHYNRMHAILKENFIDFVDEPIPIDLFLSAMLKDKKNIDDDNLSLILLDRNGVLQKTQLPNDSKFQEMSAYYIDFGRKLI